VSSSKAAINASGALNRLRRSSGRITGRQLFACEHAQMDFRRAYIGMIEPQGHLPHVTRGLKHCAA
jgi:hypothetical protein